MNRHPHTLFINRSDSECGACGRSANPHEQTHDHVLGYNPGPGCGTRWALVSSHYTGPDVAAAARRVRPDLAWVALWGDDA